MQDADRLALLALLLCEGIGQVTARTLVAYAGSAQKVFQAPIGQLTKIPGVGPKALAALRNTKAAFNRAEQELLYCQRHQIRLLTYLEPDFPPQLLQAPHLPLVLFVSGNLSLAAQPAIAVVGTRKPTEYGKRQAVRFAEFFALNGINVVSGLAYGIDVAAHKAALAVGGLTTAVVGTGLDTVYPSQHAATAHVIEEKGAVVSEYMSGTTPDPQHFPERNRIIAGLSQAVVVIEAAPQGGALITARIGFELNREVFAVPGSLEVKTSAGCHALIQQSIARLVTDPAEVLHELSLQQPKLAREAKPQAELSLQEEQVYHHISPEGVLLDQLAARVTMPVAELTALLLTMEFKGVVRQHPGKKFTRN